MAAATIHQWEAARQIGGKVLEVPTIKEAIETTVKSWNRVFQKLFATCDPPVVGGHPHRFRDTFAISLLLRGAELPNVSILLGHSSIRVTERHCSPWIKARQEQLEADVRRTWFVESRKAQPGSQRGETTSLSRRRKAR